MKRARRFAWSGFLLGICASIAANVMHMQHVNPGNTVAQWGAAFWPVALFVAGELISHVPWGRAGRFLAILGISGTVCVGAVVAIISYSHIFNLMTYWGEPELTATIAPIGVDALILVSLAALTITRSAVHDTESVNDAEPKNEPAPNNPVPVNTAPVQPSSAVPIAPVHMNPIPNKPVPAPFKPAAPVNATNVQPGQDRSTVNGPEYPCPEGFSKRAHARDVYVRLTKAGDMDAVTTTDIERLTGVSRGTASAGIRDARADAGATETT